MQNFLEHLLHYIVAVDVKLLLLVTAESVRTGIMLHLPLSQCQPSAWDSESLDTFVRYQVKAHQGASLGHHWGFKEGPGSRFNKPQLTGARLPCILCSALA